MPSYSWSNLVHFLHKVLGKRLEQSFLKNTQLRTSHNTPLPTSAASVRVCHGHLFVMLDGYISIERFSNTIDSVLSGH